MNSVSIVGRLGRDPELRTTQSGKAVASFSVAVNRPTKREDGKNDVDWIDVVAWEQKADFICKYGSKGRLVSVSGRIQVRKYETQDGQQRQAVEIIANEVNLLDKREDAPNGNGQQTQPAQQQQRPPAQQRQQHAPAQQQQRPAPVYTRGDAFEEDIPF